MAAVCGWLSARTWLQAHAVPLPGPVENPYGLGDREHLRTAEHAQEELCHRGHVTLVDLRGVGRRGAKGEAEAPEADPAGLQPLDKPT